MEWKTVKLGEVCDRVCSGGTPNSRNSKYYDGGIPWLNTKEIDFGRIYSTERTISQEGLENSSAKWIDENSVIVAMYGATAGKVAVSKIRLTTNQACCNLHIDEKKADYNFVYYYLLDNFSILASLANGGAQQNLNAQIIKDFLISLPPIETQHRIAAILSSLDDKIENNNRINRNLEAQAQALFKSWFVDFEPWGGTMPEDWKEGTLGEIAHVTSGKRPPLKQSLCSADINIPLIGAADIMGYTNSVLYTTPILVTGRVGTHGIVQRFNEPCWPSDNTLVVEGKWYEYIYQTMCRIDYHNMNRGSTQPLITQTDLKNQKVIIPNVSILDKFETQVTILYKQVYINQRENQRLATLRDTLLPKLMKGEIEI